MTPHVYFEVFQPQVKRVQLSDETKSIRVFRRNKWIMTM